MNSNTRYLLKQWIVALVVVSLGLFFILSPLAYGEYRFPMITGALSLCICLFARWRTQHRLLLLFRQPTAQAAVDFYQRAVNRRPGDGQCHASWMSAAAAALYGDFELARGLLAKVDINDRPPMFEGFYQYVLALLAILEERDYVRGTRLAERAANLCEVPKYFPGSRRSRQAFDALTAICRLLSGEATPEVIAAVKKATQELPAYNPALPAWALTLHYLKLGQPEEALLYRKLVQKLIPHSTVLNHSPDDPELVRVASSI